MICEKCNKPIGLIHRCRPLSDAAPGESAEVLARRTLAMAEAGHDVNGVALKLAQALLAPRYITSGEVEKVARALCRKRIETNHDPLIKARDAEWLQRAEDAGWQYFADDAKVALQGMGYAEA